MPDNQTTAIDILAVAAAEKHRAMEVFRATQHMQQSEQAAIACEMAIAELTLASSDLNRVHGLIHELSRPTRELVDG